MSRCGKREIIKRQVFDAHLASIRQSILRKSHCKLSYRVMDPEIAARVRSLISNSGQSNKEFALKISLDEDKLSKALNGKRKFSSFELASIAAITGSTVDWLLTGASDPVFARAARVTSATELDDSGVTLAERYSRSNQVLLRLGKREPARDLPKFEASGRFTDDGWSAALWAVEQVGAERVLGPTSELQDAIESTFDIDIAGSGDLPNGCDGLAFHHDAFRLMVLATSPIWTRRRFTLAHELGHLIFRDANLAPHGESMHPGARMNGYEEKRANAFASAFLMPESVIETELPPEDISDSDFHHLVVKFKVSPSALAVRLTQLQLISLEQRHHFQVFKSRDSWAEAELDDSDEVTVASADLAPKRMLRQFLDAYREGTISAKPLVELTNRDESLWRKLVHGVPSLTSVSPEAATAHEEDLDPTFAP